MEAPEITIAEPEPTPDVCLIRHTKDRLLIIAALIACGGRSYNRDRVCHDRKLYGLPHAPGLLCQLFLKHSGSDILSRDY